MDIIVIKVLKKQLNIYVMDMGVRIVRVYINYFMLWVVYMIACCIDTQYTNLNVYINKRIRCYKLMKIGLKL